MRSVLLAFVAYSLIATMLVAEEPGEASKLSMKWVDTEPPPLELMKVIGPPMQVPPDALPPGWSVPDVWTEDPRRTESLDASGFVVGPGGQPLAGAVVVMEVFTHRFTPPSTWPRPVAMAISNSDGEVDFGEVSLTPLEVRDSQAIQITALKRGFAVGFQIIPLKQQSTELPVYVKLENPAPLESTLRRDGQIVPHAMVRLDQLSIESGFGRHRFLMACTCSAQSDAEGNVRVDGIPARLSVDETLPLEQFQRLPHSEMPVEVTGVVTDREGDCYTVTLSRGQPTSLVDLSVRLVGRIEGLPDDPKRFYLNVFARRGTREISTVAVQIPGDGRIDRSIPVAETGSELGLMLHDRFQRDIKVRVGKAEIDDGVARLEMKISPQRWLRGRVLSHDGRGVADAEVHWLNDPPVVASLSGSTRMTLTRDPAVTDAGGWFQMSIPQKAGQIGLAISQPIEAIELPQIDHRTPITELPDTFKVSIPADPRDLDVLQLTGVKPLRVRLRVADPNGEPVAGAQLTANQIHPSGGPLVKYPEMRTDSTGLVSIAPPKPDTVLHARLKDATGRTGALALDSHSSGDRTVILHSELNDQQWRDEIFRPVILAWNRAAKRQSRIGQVTIAGYDLQPKLPPDLDVDRLTGWTLRRLDSGMGRMGPTEPPVHARRVEFNNDGNITVPGRAGLLPNDLIISQSFGSDGMLLVSARDAILPCYSMVRSPQGTYTTQGHAGAKWKTFDIRVIDEKDNPVTDAIVLINGHNSFDLPPDVIAAWTGPKTDQDGRLRARCYVEDRPGFSAIASGYRITPRTGLPDGDEVTIRMQSEDDPEELPEYPRRFGRSYLPPRICDDQQNPKRAYRNTRLVRVKVESDKRCEPLGIIGLQLWTINGRSRSASGAGAPWRIDQSPELIVEMPIGSGLEFLSNGLIGCRVGDGRLRSEPITIHAGDGIQEVVAHVIPAGLATMRLRLTNGEPIAGISARLQTISFTPTGGHSSSIEHFQTNPETTELVISPLPLDPDLLHRVTLTGPNGEMGVTDTFIASPHRPVLDFDVKDAGKIEVKGRVVDSDGDPVVGLSLTLLYSGTGVGHRDRKDYPKTDEEGRFRLSVPAADVSDRLMLYHIRENGRSSMESFSARQIRETRDLGDVIFDAP